MKVVTVVGARPQFIKCAPVSRRLRRHATEFLVHTGQHYEDGLSGVFFRDLGIPEPDVNLEVGSGRHGAQTGAILARLEEVLLAERPDWVLVYGDTNSTLAAGLAAAKLHIPVAHVEAGLRSFNRRMPEEINRILTDHVSDLLLCPTETSVRQLEREGITRGVHLVGDVMFDAVSDVDSDTGVLARFALSPGTYALATVHRAETTDDVDRLASVLGAFADLAAGGLRIVIPVHPRTREVLARHAMRWPDGVLATDPLSYRAMATLVRHARVVLTDSGGLQKEAGWLGTPCVTMRDETEWVETVAAGWNVVVGTDREKIVAAARAARPPAAAAPSPDRGAADRIVALLNDGAASR